MAQPRRLTPEEARIREFNSFADLTNIIPSSLPSTQSSSSPPSSTQSLSKYSALESPLKNPIPNNSYIPNSKLTSVESTPNNKKKKKKKEKGRGKRQINKESTSSIMSPLPKTPSVPGSSVGSESATQKRKSKRKKVAAPLSCFRGKKDEDGDNGLSKSCPLPHKKKQQWKKTEDKHDLPQDFIDKQRAYFAEIDAFELEEEEVESSDDENTFKKRK
ncbi:hypothetical protein COLO4_38187 [Corchorus olitorius]|uniref:Sororin C-terminal region domain-containing protein n=1 Tax=Corchorus olitorius TaxID=93759 RepID=A0A1R3FWH7_9ROSI|nr:hypothetical protein COLO4_38187 [Corchorus olitorius]